MNTEYGQLSSHHGVTPSDQETQLIMNASSISGTNVTAGPPGTTDMERALYRTLAQVIVRCEISFRDEHHVMLIKYDVNAVVVMKIAINEWFFIAGGLHYEYLHRDRLRHGALHLPQCDH